MKLMYVCGMYVPSHGGAEISMYSLLTKLKDKFHFDILVITDERYKKNKIPTKYDKLPIYVTSHANREKEIEKKILEFKPNIIMTQLMWSDVTLKLANKYSIPSIMRVCKVPIELNLAINSSYAPTTIISTSEYIKEYVKKQWNRNSHIIKPFVEIENYIIKKKRFNSHNNNLIFMFNPLQRKGGLIFKEIARKLPFENFGTVLGWSSLKDKRGSKDFSHKYIKRITESEGTRFDGSLPEYINFHDCKNVRVFSPKDDPKFFYKQMKILLIPSQWEEVFGRVAIEAMVNGIPVIGSNVAGLKDSIGNGGILVEKDDINEWVEAISKLNNARYYREISMKSRKWINTNYSEERILKESVDLIKSVINSQVLKNM